MGKKHNHISVSDADREIPTLGSTDNVDKSASVPALSVYSRVGISPSASKINVRFYLCVFRLCNK